MFNNITAAGHLVSDPEMRNVGDNKVCKLRMCASNNRVEDDEKIFIDVEFWNRQAEVANEYLKKGRSIVVQGELRKNTWEKDGQKQHKYFIAGQSFSFINTGNGNTSDSTEKKEKVTTNASIDDEIPF